MLRGVERDMSHSVQVTMIADQCIEIGGREVNVHDIAVIHVDGRGQITKCTLKQDEFRGFVSFVLPFEGRPDSKEQ